jgi:hypothetical protein
VESPDLHLVNLAADRVDWVRTNRYAEAARAARYVATEAPRQYAMLSAEIGQALNDVALTDDPAARLAVVERARKTLADWPAAHFGYKEAEIRLMVAMLDEAIADLRASAGITRFDLNFVTAAGGPPVREPLLPKPTPQEVIEQALSAAAASDLGSERVSLLTVALAAIERDAERLPSDWRTATRVTVRAAIAQEVEIDRRYRLLTSRAMSAAAGRARAADVRGLEQLLARIRDEDAALGGRRPDAMLSVVSTVEQQLDAARALRLARDRFAIREAELREYEALLSTPIARLDRLALALEGIRSMTGSGPATLSTVERTAVQVFEVVSPLVPPEELRAAHTLLVSAAQLATSAARIRREAALSGSMARAWDASSAAAGALMLAARARDEIARALTVPQLPQ